MTTLLQAHHQWASRPDDERFTSLDELLAFTRQQHSISRTGMTENRMIEAAPVADDNMEGGIDPRALAITGLGNEPCTPTHWAFGQMCSLVGAPAGYMRTLPSDLVADCLNQSMLGRKTESVGWLLREGQDRMAHAMTGPGYGRIWNKDVVAAVRDRFGDGITGQFTVPGEFGRAVNVTKANTTLFASDRDMFIFLADEHNKIEIPNRRHGEPGLLSRGFFIQNSEVGSAALKISTFLFDYVCSNRMVWGADDFKEVSIRHSSGAPSRWLGDIIPALQNYAEKSTRSITDAIANARAARVDEDKVEEYLAHRFTRSQAKAIRLAHIADEDRPIETVWDAVVGATAYARNIQHQDERVALERIAGKMLTSASR